MSNQHVEFMEAVRANNLGLVRQLFDGNVDSPGSMGHLGLVSAARANQVDVIKLLVSLGLDVGVSNHRPLRRAAMLGKLDAVKLLCELGSDVNASGGDALKGAAVSGHLEVVRYLLTKRICQESIDVSLLRSAGNGFAEIVRLLMDHGADYKMHDYAAVCAACAAGHLEVVQEFAAAGANLTKECDFSLSKAADFGRLQLLGWLGLKIDQYQPGRIKRALTGAASNNHVNVLRLFFRKEWHLLAKGSIEEAVLIASNSDDCFDAFVYVADKLKSDDRRQLFKLFSSLAVNADFPPRIRGHVQHELLREGCRNVPDIKMNEPKNEFKSFLDAVRGDDLKLAKKYYKKDVVMCRI